MNATVQPLVIEALAMLAKTWGGHDVRSQPEEGEEGGDAGELVPGRELRFADIVLTDDQINRLIGDKAVHAFFNIVPDKPRERMFSSFSKIRLDDKYKNCNVAITFGVSNSLVTIERATIKNINIKFTKTGDIAMGCTVVGPRPRCLEVIDLEEFGGKSVNVRIAFGPVDSNSEQQGELPLQQSQASSEEKPANDDEAQLDEAQRQYNEALEGIEGKQQNAA